MVYSSIKLQSHASVLEMDTCRTARSSDWSDLFILSSHSSLAKAHHRTGVGADPPLAPPSPLPSTLTLTLTLIQGTHQDLRRVTLEGGLEGCLEGRGRGSGRGRGHEGEALGGRGYNPPSSFLLPLPSCTLSSPKSTPPPCSPEVYKGAKPKRPTTLVLEGGKEEEVGTPPKLIALSSLFLPSSLPDEFSTIILLYHVAF